MQPIPYKIQQIKTLQFAIFPEKFINREKVQTSASFNFAYNPSTSSIRCTASIEFMQNEVLLLTTEIQCFFSIAPEGIEQLQNQQEVPVGFLQYMGTITTGTVRGIIHAKTEGTVLNSIVLPPLNLTEAITEGMHIGPAK